MREQRLHRFHEMVARLPALGVTVDQHAVRQRIDKGGTLGRHDVAVLLVQAGRAPTISAAITRYLRDGGPVVTPKRGIPVGEAIALLHGAGGVCSWAHPPPELTRESVLELREMGLDALEAEYPAFKRSTMQRLRELAKSAGMAISGGSDCHGPTPATRAIGTCAILRNELEDLRQVAAQRQSKVISSL